MIKVVMVCFLLCSCTPFYPTKLSNKKPNKTEQVVQEKDNFTAITFGFSEWFWKGDPNFGIPTINSTLSLRIEKFLIGTGVEYVIEPEITSPFLQLGFLESGVSLSAEFGYYFEPEKIKSSLTIGYDWIFEPVIFSINASAIYFNDFLLSFGTKIGFCFNFDDSR